MELYQLVVVVIAGVMLVHGVVRFSQKKEGQTLLKLLFRVVVWGGMIVVTLFPQVTYSLANVIGLEGNVNAVILTGFLLVFLMIFKLLSTVERLERNISTLTRQTALKDLKKSSDKTE